MVTHQNLVPKESEESVIKYRTVWISDVHLGTRVSKVSELSKFLKKVSAEKIYLVGDIIDGWALKSKWYWPEEHTAIVRKILKAAKHSHVVYIPGNHDESIRQFCPLDFSSIEVKTFDVHTTADGKRIVVLHGDIFDALVCNLKHVAVLGGIAYDLLIKANAIHSWVLDKMGAEYWSLAEFVKSRAREAIKAMDRYESAAVQYAKVKGYDGIACGHIHHPKISTHIGDDSKIVYLNSGDWVENCSAIVENFDGTLEIVRARDL